MEATKSMETNFCQRMKLIFWALACACHHTIKCHCRDQSYVITNNPESKRSMSSRVVNVAAWRDAEN